MSQAKISRGAYRTMRRASKANLRLVRAYRELARRRGFQPAGMAPRSCGQRAA
jgi:hypothetical protein